VRMEASETEDQAGEMNTTITVPRGFNLNTVVQIVGFLVLFGTVVAGWSNLQNNQTNFGRFIEEQKLFNGKVEERFVNGGKILSQVPVLQNDLARIEATSDKANSAQDDRIGRLADSANDIRSGVSDLKTQLALVKQSLDRIEAWGDIVQSPIMRRRNGSSDVPN